MPRVVHFEIHATEPERLSRFYAELLGWKIQKWGENPYWLIDSGPADQPGINGGLLPRRGAPPTDGQSVNAFVCTVEVPDLDGTLARALELGASTALPKMAIPGVGLLSYIKDPDGNILGLLQPEARAG
ncbi:MAG: VOC family protein [Gemmatimonadetes bacterium]|nr:VOC family protein [Gemmatimonadota bacterium]